MTRPKLALCMIVRDASRTIDALLESVKGAYDEYVFVDTGSVDDTREKIAKAFGGPPAWAGAWEEGVRVVPQPEDPRVVLASFDWIDDFAAARNYAFSLAAAEWRMFLDADDVLPNAQLLREFVSERPAHINAVSMGYAYAKGHSEQDKIRLVRWLDDAGEPLGWEWQDELHEYLTLPGKQKRISKAASFTVVHLKDQSEHFAAAERNMRIARKVYENATGEKRGRFAYHMAQEAKLFERWDDVSAYMTEVLKTVPGTNLAAFALRDLSYIASVKQADPTRGLSYAAVLMGQMPGFVRDGQLLAGVAHALNGALDSAAYFFDQAFAREEALYSDVREVWFNDGYAPALAAVTYCKLKRFDDAERAFNRISGDCLGRADVRDLALFVQQAIMQQKGLDAVVRLVDYLCWDTEAPKALELLEVCVPAAISNLVEIGQLKRSLKKHLPHLESWEAYKAAYASIPADIFHTASEHRSSVLELARTQRVVAWAKALPKEGEPIVVASVGFQDGIIESCVMDENPRIRFVVCDVGPQANRGLAELQERYPGRVTSHDIEANAYDWADAPRSYDALIIFEVIEHVPDEHEALIRIRAALKAGGELFMSTPVASRWVEPYLTQPGLAPSWYGHVRANNHVTFWQLLHEHGFDGTLYEEHDGTFVAHMRKTEVHRPVPVSVYVPGTPKPFNAFSHETGFVGGSEECVIHLSKHLAALGFAVTVYSPTPPGYPVVRGHEGVLWRPVEEFDVESEDHGTVLFWRCPGLVPEKAPYRKLLWLHDAFYGVPGEVYDRPDAVLVLSDSHAQSLMEYDGLDRGVWKVSNGIAAESFPKLAEGERDEKRVVYASSPERGLGRLLAVWSDVLAAVPDAKLDVYYDWAGFEAKFPEDARKLREAIGILNSRREGEEPSITVHGGVDHETLHAAFRRAAVWAYSTKGPVETFCITAVKAMASGCLPVVSDAGALAEVTGRASGMPWAACPAGLNDETVDTEEGLALFKEALIAQLNNSMSYDDRAAMREWAITKYNWSSVAERFAAVIRK